jgi:HEAT repeat protein
VIAFRGIERTRVGLFTSFQLKSGDAETRRRAAQSLGVRGKRSAIASLQPLLDDPEWEVRQAAVESLGVVADVTAVPSLLAAVKSADQVADPDGAAAVRASTVEALGRIGSAGLPAVLEALKNRHARLRETAIGALGAIGGSESVSALAAMVDDDRSSVRQAAVSALARAAGPAAIPALRRVLGHKDPASRRTAAEALANVGDAAAVDALRGALADGDRQVRDAAVRALTAIATPEAVAALVEGLHAGDREMKSAIAAGLASFDWAPRDAVQRAVHATIRGRFDDAAAEGPAAVPPLVAALADRDPDRRQGAVAALGRLGVAAAAVPIAALFKDADPRVRDTAADALAAIGPDAADTILDAFRDRANTVRAAAARSLSALGEGRVAATLVAGLSAGRPARHGGVDLRIVAARAELDGARHAADALDTLVRHAAATVPVDALRAIAAVTDVILLEAGRVPDGSDRIDAEELRHAAALELRRRGL